MRIFGLHVLTERRWTERVIERVTLQHERDALRAELVNLVSASKALGVEIEAHRSTDKQIRTAVETVLACNVKLARRAEVAEAVADDLRRQLVEALGRS